MIATAATTATEIIAVVTTVTILITSLFLVQVVFPVDICIIASFFSLLRNM